MIHRIDGSAKRRLHNQQFRINIRNTARKTQSIPTSLRVDDLGIILGYWKDNEARWRDLARLAYDALSIPAMSAECERCFSSGSLLFLRKGLP
jgi:hypothetical protein